MAQPATKASSKWTDNHESALTGLMGLKIPKKEAQSFLEGLPPADVAELMRQALASRARSQKPPPNVSGGPQGAVPLNAPQPSGERTPTAPSTSPKPAPPPVSFQAPGGWSASSMAPAQKTERVRPAPAMGPQISGNWSAGSMAGQPVSTPQQPPAAPITPAAAQTQPAPQTPVPEKPRIRIRAAGQRIPPAPIAPGAAPEPGAPAAAKQQAAAPLPLISSKEEYDQLAPGTEFIWKSDAHVYEKPAERGAAVEKVQ